MTHEDTENRMEQEILTGWPLSMMTSFDILLLLIQSNYIKTELFCETENLSYINNYPIENGNFVKIIQRIHALLSHVILKH